MKMWDRREEKKEERAEGWWWCGWFRARRVRPGSCLRAANWVAEHLGASSRRPRHPFSALMAGDNPGRVPVYTALPAHPKSSTGTSTTWRVLQLRNLYGLPDRHDHEKTASAPRRGSEPA